MDKNMKVKLLDYRNTHQFRVDGIMGGHKLKKEEKEKGSV